jgi:hypothetical protein
MQSSLRLKPENRFLTESTELMSRALKQEQSKFSEQSEFFVTHFVYSVNSVQTSSIAGFR